MLEAFRKIFNIALKPRTQILRVLSTFPRSGTHWLKCMIGVVMHVKPLEKRLRDPEKLKIALNNENGKRLCYDHFAFDLHGDILNPAQYPSLRMVLLYRNPLDTLISQFYAKEQKKQLAYPELDAMGNLKKLLRNPRWMERSRENIRVRVLEWLRQDWVYPVRYEDLVADTEKELIGVLEHLEISYTPVVLSKAIEKNRFEILSGGRSRGEEDIQSHYRKGVPGEWKKIFDKEDIEIFRRHLGDYFEEIGYSLELDDGPSPDKSSPEGKHKRDAESTCS